MTEAQAAVRLVIAEMRAWTVRPYPDTLHRWAAELEAALGEAPATPAAPSASGPHIATEDQAADC